MVLEESSIQEIIDFVKKEPRTIQEISQLLNKSWVTADTYIRKVKEKTGLIDIKTFRKGTQGALKLVYYASPDLIVMDDVKKKLYYQIINNRKKEDFDFLEVFQFIPDQHKISFLEEYADSQISIKQNFFAFLKQAKQQIYVFSGNLSFINMEENGVRFMEVLEELLSRKVILKILCRVNIASVKNISAINHLIQKYPHQIEIKHCFHPLRGFIIDDNLMRFKSEEHLNMYKAGELEKNLRVFYEISDHDWINWLQNIFWKLFRTSIDYQTRLKEIERVF